MFNSTAIKEFIEILEKVPAQLRALDRMDFSFKKSPNKWSKKEILGHLIDSALNNHRRIIKAQYEESPLIDYNQDKWVLLNDWQDFPLDKLISYWEMVNTHLLTTIKRIPKESLTRLCNVGSGTYSIEYIISDYVEHMKHHLKQIMV
jgi:hypothetical protein